MGDMADDLIDRIDEYDYCRSGTSSPVCHRCGFDDLRWGRTSFGWRLYHTDGNMHFCLKRKEKPVSDIKFSTFYILWQPESNLPPTKKFTDRKEAYEVAEFMTQKHKVPFYVLKAQGLCQLSQAPIKWETAGGKKK